MSDDLSQQLVFKWKIMVDLNEDDVIQILKLIEESRFGELHLEMGDLKVIASKSENGVLVEKKGFSEKAISVKGDPPAPSDLTQPSEQQEKKKIIAEEIAELGLIPIKSPMLGTFYMAPKPGEPSFVEIDTVVDDKTTICIIEVMKLYSSIPAGVNGRIKRICAEDGELVEFGQVLFLVEPDTNQNASGKE